MVFSVGQPICLALLSLLLWPALGRTVSEPQGSQSEPKIQLCGSHLRATLKEICGSYYSFEIHQGQTFERRTRNGLGSYEFVQVMFPRRLRRALTDECCRKACLLSNLRKYCQPPAPRTTISAPIETITEEAALVTMNPPATTMSWLERLGEFEREYPPNRIRPRLTVPKSRQHRVQTRAVSAYSSPSSQYLRSEKVLENKSGHSLEDPTSYMDIIYEAGF